MFVSCVCVFVSVLVSLFVFCLCVVSFVLSCCFLCFFLFGVTILNVGTFSWDLLGVAELLDFARVRARSQATEFARRGDI